MKKKIVAATAVALSLSLAACNTPGDRARGGALLGAATGAAVGAATTGKAGGALAGAVLGGATGAMVGAATARRCAEYEYDYNGNRVCTAYY